MSRRVAGGLLVLSGLWGLAVYALADSADTSLGRAVTASVVDLGIGALLLSGRKGNVLTLARFRAYVGVAIWPLYTLVNDGLLSGGLQLVLSATLAFLLSAPRGRRHTYWAAAAHVAATLAIGLIPLVAALRPNMEQLLTDSSTPLGVERRVQGSAQQYVLTAPTSRWRLLKPEESASTVPGADRVLVRPDADAYLAVYVVNLKGQAIDPEKFAARELDVLKRNLSHFEFIGTEPLLTDMDDARLLHFRGRKGEEAFEYLHALWVDGERAYKVQGWSFAKNFELVSSDMRSVFGSFAVERTPSQKGLSLMRRRMRADSVLQGHLVKAAPRDPEAYSRQLTSHGLKRLRIEQLQRQFELRLALLKAVDEAQCAAIVRGTVSANAFNDALSRLGEPQVLLWMENAYGAAAAEVRQAAFKPVGQGELEAAFDTLLGREDAQTQRLVKVLTKPQLASDSDVCWAERLYAEKVLKLGPTYRNTLVRYWAQSLG